MTTEIEVGGYYKWDRQNIVVRVLEVIGDEQNGGMVLVDQLGERTPIGMHFFLTRYTQIHNIPNLEEHAQENQG